MIRVILSFFDSLLDFEDIGTGVYCFRIRNRLRSHERLLQSTERQVLDPHLFWYRVELLRG